MAGGPGSQPALHPLTADDRGSLILIVAYGWIFITSLVAAIRFGLAWSHKLRFKVDDTTFVIGAVSPSFTWLGVPADWRQTFAVAGSVCFHVAVNDGLGKRIEEVSPAHLGQYFKVLSLPPRLLNSGG